MNDVIKTDAGALTALFHGTGTGLSIPTPFEREIFLFDTFVAGTTYIEGIEELELHLNINDKLDFFREPNNPHDSKAIVVKNDHGVKIGYVPMEDNVVFSRLMDAGKVIFGKITEKQMKGKWLKIKMDIYLRD